VGTVPAVQLRGYSTATPNLADDDLRQWTEDWLAGPLGKQIARLVADGVRIVQETVGVELIGTSDPGHLFIV